MGAVASAVGSILPLGAIGIASKLFSKPKKAAVTPPPTIDMPRGITRNDAVDAAMRDDERRRRRGMGANLLTGPMGAEASTAGGKMLLGQ